MVTYVTRISNITFCEDFLHARFITKTLFAGATPASILKHKNIGLHSLLQFKPTGLIWKSD